MESLLWVGIVQAGFVAVFLSFKADKRLDDKILAAWMLVFVLPVLSGMTDRLFPDTYIPVLSADFIYPLTQGPFMLLYVQALTGEMKKLDRSSLINFLPFGLVCAFQVLTGWAPPPPSPHVAEFGAEVRILGAVSLAVFLAYSVVIFKRLFRHETKIMEQFSELSNRLTLRWLRWIAVGLSGVFLLLFLASTLSMPFLIPFHIAAQTVIIFALSFFALRQRQIYTSSEDMRDDNNDLRRVALATTKMLKPSYSRSGLSDEHCEEILHKLLQFMTTQRPYLDPEITIEKLAKRMAVQRHHLTEVINRRQDKNFFTFVNEYRIDAVKQAMTDPNSRDLTLLGIAQECGFNSKSSFNLAFKRITGQTPSSYRNQID